MARHQPFRPEPGIRELAPTSEGARRFQAYIYDPTKKPKPGQVTKSFATVEEARRWLKVQRASLQRTAKAAPPAEGALTLMGFVEDHSARLFGGRASRTVEHYDSMLRNHVYPYFGDVALDQITPDDLMVWLHETLPRKGLALNTRRGVYVAFNKVLAAATKVRVDHRPLLAFNPLSELDKPPPAPKTDMVVLLPHELDELIAQFDEDYPVLVRLMAFAGLRISEAFGLAPTDLDFSVENVTVQRQVDRRTKELVPTKGKRSRTVPVMDDELQRGLRALRSQRRRGAPLLFPMPNGRPIDYGNFLKRRWNPVVEHMGLNMTPHDLRHTAVSLWLAAGVDISDVSAWAGHPDVAFTLDTYGHPIRGNRQAAVQKMQEFRRRAAS